VRPIFLRPRAGVRHLEESSVKGDERRWAHGGKVVPSELKKRARLSDRTSQSVSIHSRKVEGKEDADQER